MRCLLVLFLLICCFKQQSTLNAQIVLGADSSAVIKRDSSGKGYVIYKHNPSLDALIEKYKKMNYAAPGLEGYRVQIFSEAGNNAKDRANLKLQEFQTAFFDTPSYLTYEQPNFKVRCGDFRTKAEARKLQKRIAYQFPGAFIVRDHIKVL